MDVRVVDHPLARAQVGGRDVPDEALGQDRLRVTFHAPPDDGLQATFSVDGDGAANGDGTPSEPSGKLRTP